MKQVVNIRTIFFSKAGVLFLVLGILFLVKSQYSQYQKRAVINEEIRKLQEQELKLTQKNKELEESILALHSTSFKEKIGREQLNLKKEGEIVINYSDNSLQKTDGTTSETKVRTSGDSKVMLWWSYFFKN